jgi:hypothetical protein
VSVCQNIASVIVLYIENSFWSIITEVALAAGSGGLFWGANFNQMPSESSQLGFAAQIPSRVKDKRTSAASQMYVSEESEEAWTMVKQPMYPTSVMRNPESNARRRKNRAQVFVRRDFISLATFSGLESVGKAKATQTHSTKAAAFFASAGLRRML